MKQRYWSDNNMADSERARSVSSSSSSSSDSTKKVRTLLGKGKRRRHTAYDISKEDEETVDKLIKAMDEACTQDIEANNKGLPALRKMLLLRRVVSLLKVEKFQEVFLEMNGCLVLARWLSPMPDGCFPHSRILTDVLESLRELQVSTEHLEAFSLGHAVMVVAESAEDVQVRKLAHALVDRWSRQIFEINTSWSSLDPESSERDPSDLPPPETNLHRLIQSDANTGNIRVPDKNQFDFKYRPPSKSKDLLAKNEIQGPRFMQRRRPRSRKLHARMSADGKGLISG